MTKRMLVHDKRLGGIAPFIAQNTYTVDASVTTAHLCGWIAEYARSQGGLDELLIFCHGYAVLGDSVSMATFPEPRGANGLQLGSPGLSLRNTELVRPWKSAGIDSIYIYSCGVGASSAHGQAQFDGARFCGELALIAGADVYASDKLQWYTRVAQNGAADRINFGDWEGQVKRYSAASPMGSNVSLPAQPF
jgi:hypothetical protein